MAFLEILTLLCLLAIFYTLVGYWLIMLILARLAPKPYAKADILPSVSLLICAYNEAAHIQDKIRNTLALDYPAEKLDVIVVSDGSEDGTDSLAMAAGNKRITVLHYAGRKGKPTALNTGLARARGEIVIFSDARAIYRPDAVRMLVRSFAAPEVGAVAGDFRYKRDQNSAGSVVNHYLDMESRLKLAESRSGSTMGINGIMLATRRELLGELPTDFINEDAVIGLSILRQGKRIVYEPDARCSDIPPSDSSQENSRRIRISAGRLQILRTPALWLYNGPDNVWRYVSHKLLRLALPFFMTGCLLFPLTGFAFSPEQAWWMNALLAVQTPFWLAVPAAPVLKRAGIKNRLLMLLCCCVRNIFAVIPAWRQLARGEANVLWKKIDRSGQNNDGRNI